MPGSAPPPSQPGRAGPGPAGAQRRERAQRRPRHAVRALRRSPRWPGRRGSSPRRAPGAALVDLAVGTLVGAAVGAGCGAAPRWSRDPRHQLPAHPAPRRARAAVHRLLRRRADRRQRLRRGLRRRLGLRRPGPAGPTRRRRWASPRHWPTRSGSRSGSPSASSPCPCSPRTSAGPRSPSQCSPSPCCGWCRLPWSCSAPGFRPPTVAFVGWFGPRGLASVVFTLLALEGLELDAGLTQAWPPSASPCCSACWPTGSRPSPSPGATAPGWSGPARPRSSSARPSRAAARSLQPARPAAWRTGPPA